MEPIWRVFHARLAAIEMIVRRRPVAVVLAAFTIAFTGCAVSSRVDIGTAAIGVREVPATEAELTGDIPALDLYVDVHRSLHLVWIVSSRSGTTRLFYARGDNMGSTWTTPQPIADKVFGRQTVRMLQGADGLHVLFDTTLRHLVSRDNGATWSEQESLIAQRRLATDFFDAAAVDDQVVAVYLTHPRTAYDPRGRTEDTNQELYTVRWRAQERPATTLITSFPGSVFPPLSPRLIADSSHLHLLCAVHAERQNGPTVEGKLFYLRGYDAGARWSGPIDIFATPNGAVASGQTQLHAAAVLAFPDRERPVVQSIEGIDMIAGAGGLLVVYNDATVYATQSADGTRWTAPVRIHRGAGWATYVTRSISAAAEGADGRVIWIDTGRRKSDRSWLNPLGGFPWSDDPDWSNNDVMMLSLEAVRRRTEPDTPKVVPERLTRNDAFARVVRVRAATDSSVAVWSGRRKVGKRLDTYGEQPRLFYAVLRR